jgi:hypothetical protein
MSNEITKTQQELDDTAASERSLYLASVCEAGYITVAAFIERLAFGARIERNPNRDVENSPIWIGRTIGVPMHRVMREVAVAGLAAEYLVDDPDVEPIYVWSRIGAQIGPPGELFTTLLPKERELLTLDDILYGLYPECEKALRTLREQRKFVDWAVAQLLIKRELTPDEVIQHLSDRANINYPDLCLRKAEELSDDHVPWHLKQ